MRLENSLLEVDIMSPVKKIVVRNVEIELAQDQIDD